MNMYNIDEFKCTLCKNWYCPPLNLPYLLKCTHSVCTNCVQKSRHSGMIICPEDLEANNISDIDINRPTKKALQRLLKEHKNYHENTKLECIQNLTFTFNSFFDSNEEPLTNLIQLINRVFESEIKRIKAIHEKIIAQLRRPKTMVDQWKEQVQLYLIGLKKNSKTNVPANLQELYCYIEQGRRIKLQLNQLGSTNWNELADDIMANPSSCLHGNFDLLSKVQPELKTKTRNSRKETYSSNQKENTLNSRTKGQPSLKSSQDSNLLSSQLRFSQSQRQIFQNKHANPLVQIHNVNKLNKLNNQNQQPQSSKPSRPKMGTPPKQVNQKLMRELLQLSAASSSRKNLRLEELSPFCSKGHSPQKEQSQRSNLMLTESDINPQQACSFGGNSLVSSNQFNPSGYRNHQRQSLDRAKTVQQLSGPQTIEQQQTEEEQEEYLLAQDSKPVKRGNINFFEPKLPARTHTHTQGLLEVRNFHYSYNCEKEKLNYLKKMQMLRVEEAIQETLLKDDHLELINYSVHEMEMGLYLQHFDWDKLEIVKLVKCSLSDDQFNEVLNYMLKSQVSSLVVSGNNLHDCSLDALVNFSKMENTLKNVYLTNNYINTLKAKNKLNILKQKGIIIYI